MRFKKFTTTMNEQLKLTLASGVVHGLKCRVKGEEEVYTIVGYYADSNSVKVKEENLSFRYYALDIELLMHPISRLTEPILTDGKIPIVELAKMAFPHYEWESNSQHAFAYDGSETIRFLFNGKSFSAGTAYHFFITNQLALFDQLDAWHINYRGVEAVEIETSIND